MKDIIVTAITETKQVIPGYFENTCRQRLTGGSGSCFDGVNSIEEMEKLLKEANWAETSHPDVIPGCKAYVTTDIPGGRFGLISIDSLPDDAIITASDPKGTGKVSMVVEGQKGEFVRDTYLIIGNEDGHDVVFTFHPGEPVRPSLVETTDVADGQVVTKAEAKAFGFDLAKIK